MKESNGNVFSTFAGTCIDGEGLRFLVFLAGCNLRCPFCHNVDVVLAEGEPTTAEALYEKTKRYYPYFATNGGVTVSGGEPLLQQEFLFDYFTLLKADGIDTAIETNGTLLPNVALLPLIDTFIIDIKNMLLPLSNYKPILDLTQKHSKKVVLTNVQIPEVNDSDDDKDALYDFISQYNNVSDLRFLPLSTLCKDKYEKLGLDFDKNIASMRKHKA